MLRAGQPKSVGAARDLSHPAGRATPRPQPDESSNQAPNSGDVISCINQWREHCLRHHNLFLPSMPNYALGPAMSAASGDWTVDTAKVHSTYPPIYWVHRGVNIVDPREQVAVADACKRAIEAAPVLEDAGHEVSCVAAQAGIW